MIVYQEVQVDSYYNYTLNQVDYTSKIGALTPITKFIKKFQIKNRTQITLLDSNPNS